MEWAQTNQEQLLKEWDNATNHKKLQKIPLSNKHGDMGFKRVKIVACKALPHYCVWIRFDDGLEGEVDLSELVGKGVFAAWESVEFFNQVQVDRKTDTLAWGDDIDLDPYILCEKLTRNWAVHCACRVRPCTEDSKILRPCRSFTWE